MNIRFVYQKFSEFACKQRYRCFIEDYYTHFCILNFRIEFLFENEKDWIICIIKGGSPHKTNEVTSFSSNIIGIFSNNEQYVYNKNECKKFNNILIQRCISHKKWGNLHILLSKIIIY